MKSNKNKLLISTWNVNGLRASFPKGLKDLLQNKEGKRPDIICLQETKIPLDLVPQFKEEFLKLGFDSAFSCALKKGYSGVAILWDLSLPMPDIKEGIGVEKFDSEGRTLLASFPSFHLFSCYYPNGQRDHNRVPFKLEYSELIAQKSLSLSKQKITLVAGDFNTAHRDIDLKNPKQNSNTTGFLPIEKEFLDSYMARGFIDTFRLSHPELIGAYTWWTYRGDCREKNVGWRIDYFFVDQKGHEQILDSFHSPEILGSDHCPTNIVFKLP